MQIFQGVQMSRPVPFDRNGVVRSALYNVAQNGPVGSTTVLTYTVPAGKRGYLEVLTSLVQRLIAATAVSVADLIWIYTKSGSSAVSIQYCTIFLNGLGSQDNESLTGFGFIGAGDVVSLQVLDSSTGGQCLYNGAYKLMEFDP